MAVDAFGCRFALDGWAVAVFFVARSTSDPAFDDDASVALASTASYLSNKYQVMLCDVDILTWRIAFVVGINYPSLFDLRCVLFLCRYYYQESANVDSGRYGRTNSGFGGPLRLR